MADNNDNNKNPPPESSSDNGEKVVEASSSSTTATPSTQNKDTNTQPSQSQQGETSTIEEEAKEEWEIQRDQNKSLADTAFRSRNYPSAIKHYTSALSLDPTNHILLSNRSAAYLSNSEKSRALADAKECIKLKDDWSKGYTRCGAAMMSLGRYSEAREYYSKALKMDKGENAVATKGIAQCFEEEKRAKEREMELMKRKKQMEEERIRKEKQQEEERKKKEQQEAEKKKQQENDNKTEEDDLLDDFFNEVEETATTSSKPTEDTTQKSTPPREEEPQSKNISTQLTKLGTPTQQINRLLQTNHEWKNLNPFYVLDIPHTTPFDVISRRYKAISLLIHPDKCKDDIRAKDAFEQVRIAMNILKDEDKRKHVTDLIDQGMKQGKRDYDSSSSSSKKPTHLSKEAQEAELQKTQEKAIMKLFATIEQKRRDVERRKRAQEKRERDQEDEEKFKVKKEQEFNKRWREGDRVDRRVGNWRDFQTGSGGGSSGSGGNAAGSDKEKKRAKKNRWG